MTTRSILFCRASFLDGDEIHRVTGQEIGERCDAGVSRQREKSRHPR